MKSITYYFGKTPKISDNNPNDMKFECDEVNENDQGVKRKFKERQSRVNKKSKIDASFTKNKILQQHTLKTSNKEGFLNSHENISQLKPLLELDTQSVANNNTRSFKKCIKPEDQTIDEQGVISTCSSTGPSPAIQAWSGLEVCLDGTTSIFHWIDE
ncbi:hypothetical protein TKK_0011873 [Trichogramma kaykai]|uniref:Uncharacterized protein n=1 Tax=Trichogramma kaykai TaxID=54128 RepID=A0ABD2WRE5_9HYME